MRQIPGAACGRKYDRAMSAQLEQSKPWRCCAVPRRRRCYRITGTPPTVALQWRFAHTPNRDGAIRFSDPSVQPSCRGSILAGESGHQLSALMGSLRPETVSVRVVRPMKAGNVVRVCRPCDEEVSTIRRVRALFLLLPPTAVPLLATLLLGPSATALSEAQKESATRNVRLSPITALTRCLPVKLRPWSPRGALIALECRDGVFCFECRPSGQPYASRD